MKTLLILLLILIDTIISDDVQSIGAFATRDFTDSQCTITSNMANVLFTGYSDFWFRGKSSVKKIHGTLFRINYSYIYLIILPVQEIMLKSHNQ